MSVENQAGSDAAPSESVVQTEAPIESPQEGVNDAAQEKQKTGNPKIDDPWPESARNKVNRLNKQLAERSARERDLAKKLANYEAAQEKATRETGAPKQPHVDDYDNFGDYLEAVAKFRPQERPQETVDPKKLEEQAYATAKETVHYEQRVNHVAQQAQKAMAESPELQQLFADNEDILDLYPPQIEKVFLDADNAPAAFYALAKEGKLDLLAQMNPTQAAYTIAQAQIRGEQMMKAAKVSKAPPPIQGAKGASSGGKDPNSMSGKELRKKYGV